MKETNILSWSEYLAEGGQLTYTQWVQCLIDLDNITKEIGDRLISNYRCLYMMETAFMDEDQLNNYSPILDQ